MDNFNQFYKLLDSIFTKKDAGIEPDETNFNLYLMNRYCSFYHPVICQLINDTTNVYGFVNNPDDDSESYKVLRAVIPKLSRQRIEYVSKPSTKNQNLNGISDEELTYLSEYYELGKRELREMLC